ncbi:segregation/condensation protein A [Aggregicoccus sp. 17bor-14]|uniref:segregation and condensation protein A n=1 Tax=Myxococcaceae TaxID=31 RepID=UPI0012F25A9F|nr:segregation/condensation protein A [Simulacricoccus sp. 17bor-14]MRI86708.1 segregation/condensation protein A [Aggregicoccus sp. 17bor-14]
MSEGRRAAPPDEALSEGDAPALSPAAAFRVALPNFEGPLDLLLHLIREHRVDIFDIPIALITEKYLEQLERMREIDLDIAGEFLVMAATLGHIKSRLLLPRQEAAQAAESVEALEEQRDPRAELVRRLLDYQKYKDAAEMLAKQDILDRDVFARKVPVEAVPIPEEEVGLQEFSVLKLIEALDRVLERLTPKLQHEVVRETFSISEAILKVAEKVLAGGNQASFESLFEDVRTRHQIVVTFLAILEMCKRRLLRVSQAEAGQDIILTPNGDALERLVPTEVDESDYR